MNKKLSNRTKVLLIALILLFILGPFVSAPINSEDSTAELLIGLGLNLIPVVIVGVIAGTIIFAMRKAK
jgi:hypothetical protein